MGFHLDNINGLCGIHLKNRELENEYNNTFQIFFRITKKRWESKKFLCDDCGFTCASKATLNTHKMFKHGDLPPKSLTCDACGKYMINPIHHDIFYN